MFGGALVFAILRRGLSGGLNALVPPLAAAGAAAAAGAGAPVPFSPGLLFLTFLNDFVQRLGWLSDRQLLDAVAVGQFTPGSVFTTATFIGHLTGGGAVPRQAQLGLAGPRRSCPRAAARRGGRLGSLPHRSRWTDPRKGRRTLG